MLKKNKKVIISSRKNEYLSDLKLRYKNYWLINLTLTDKFFLDNNLNFTISNDELKKLNQINYLKKINH